VIRLALIGAGRWGKNILRTLKEIGSAEVTVLNKGDARTPDAPRLRGIGGVLIATPGSTHARIARPFLLRGISTFIEKPLATTLRDARLLARAAKRSGAVAMVGHVHLYNPAYLKAKELALRGGPIRFLFSEGMNNGPYRDDLSALWDWAPHDIALALDLLGTTPSMVQAWGLKTLRPKSSLHDVAFLRLRFPHGEELFSAVSWLAPEKRKRLTIVGKRDSVVFDDTATKKVTVYHGLGPTVRRGRVTRHEPSISHPAYGDAPPLRRELEAFLHGIRTHRQPLPDLTHGVATVRILDAAERSIARGGRWVRLE